jgi:hypothetical protein
MSINTEKMSPATAAARGIACDWFGGVDWIILLSFRIKLYRVCLVAKSLEERLRIVLRFGLRLISFDTGVTGIEYPVRSDQLQ